jgi:hypothetical protein
MIPKSGYRFSEKDHAPMQNPGCVTVVFGYDGEAEGGVERRILSCRERL